MRALDPKRETRGRGPQVTYYLEKRRAPAGLRVEEQPTVFLAKIDDKDFGLYLVVLGPSIICFMKSIAASAVGCPEGVAMYSASVSV